MSLEQALYLIRSTLLTLNDANRTGNYTVLRDLASPDFQARNTAADLSLSFADLRRRNFDMFSVALAAPQLSLAARARPQQDAAAHRLLPDPAAADQFRPLVPERRRPMAAVRHLGRDATGLGAAAAAAAGRGAESRTAQKCSRSQEEVKPSGAQPPLPPAGLGLASTGDIGAINVQLGAFNSRLTAQRCNRSPSSQTCAQ